MARKRRTIQDVDTAVEEKKKVAYRDSFQQNLGRTVEDVGRKFGGNGKNLLYAAAALAVLITLIGVFALWSRRGDAAAQTALGKAIETSQAQVTSSPLPAGSTAKTFKTEKERAEASISEFQAVADKYTGDVRDKAKYFVAVNKLSIDRQAGIAELQALKDASGDTGSMAKFALAQALAADGKAAEAIALYRELSESNSVAIPKDTVNFNLAELYRAQGDTQEASNLYYKIAYDASQATGLDGKNIPLAGTPLQAKNKLKEINPEKAKELPDPVQETNNGTTGKYVF